MIFMNNSFNPQERRDMNRLAAFIDSVAIYLFSFALVLLFLVQGCEERTYHILDVSGRDDESFDKGGNVQIPVDICPENYTENRLELYPGPKIVFGTFSRINLSGIDISFEIQNEDYLRDFFEEFYDFYKKRYDRTKSNLVFKIQNYRGLESIFHKCNLKYDIKKGAYYLKTVKKNDQIITYIVADDEEGFYNAAKSLSQMIFKNRFFMTSFYDYPYVALRGVAEAFYGRPWGESDRLDAITYLSLLKFNIFLYSPKADAYAWAMWRTPFTEEEENKLRMIATHSKRLGIVPCYGIGPGYDIKFSNNRDYIALLKKYESLINLGFDRCLVLAFDDTQKSLSEEDITRFSSMAEAQVYLAKRLYEDIKKIKSDIMLAFVPNDYTTEWAKNDTYLSFVAKELKDRYRIAWTGSVVVSPQITIADLNEIEEIIGTTPILADNYPVCDLMFGGGAAFLGPIVGRSPEIFERISMYASNPMRYTISSIIPLGTISDMLWSPYQYESESSFRRSIKFFANEGRESDIYEFATNLRSSLITDKESPELKEAIENLLSHWQDCNHYSYQEIINKFFLRFKKMEEILSGASDIRFFNEMMPWIEKLRYYGEAGEFAVNLLNDRCNSTPITQNELNRLSQMMEALREDNHRICGEVMDSFLKNVYDIVSR
jgi:hyaluronoglucosaminidase